MLLLAWLVAAPAALALAMITVTARPTRGENMVGFHRISGPIALALTLAVALAFLAGAAPEVMPGWLLVAALPGWFVALVMLPFACFERRGARVARLLSALALVAVGLVLGGHAIGDRAQLAGAVLVVGFGLVTVGGGLCARYHHRIRWFFARRRPPSPDSYESKHSAFEREQFAALPADAPLDTLLGFARAIDPGVREACHARLMARPNLVPELLVRIESEQPKDALHFLTHHYRGPRPALAAPFGALLDRLREDWTARLPKCDKPESALGPALNLVSAGLTLLGTGSALWAPLTRWRSLLNATPGLERDARIFRRLLWPCRLKGLFCRVKDRR